MPSGFVAPQSKTHKGYSLSSRLAIRSLLHNNSTARSFQSGPHLGKNTPERKDYIMDKLVVPVEE